MQNGITVAGGNGQGNSTNQRNGPESIDVDDCSNDRFIQWSKDATMGEVVANAQGAGNQNNQLNRLRNATEEWFDGLLKRVHVEKHEVRRWKIGEKNGTLVAGGNRAGAQANQLYDPWDLSVDRQNDLYVVDHDNHRI